MSICPPPRISWADTGGRGGGGARSTTAQQVQGERVAVWGGVGAVVLLGVAAAFAAVVLRRAREPDGDISWAGRLLVLSY